MGEYVEWYCYYYIDYIEQLLIFNCDFNILIFHLF